MPIPPVVATAINQFFTTLAPVTLGRVISGDGNKYELYVYSVVYKALKRRFPAITVQGLDAGGRFIFRCSPGIIRAGYSYFTFSNKKGQVFELRNGIEIHGHVMEHEMDVLVVEKNIPGYGPNPTTCHALRLALECKFYADNSSLKGEVRKFLGAMTDLSQTAQVIMESFPAAGEIHSGQAFFKSFITNKSAELNTRLERFVYAHGLWPLFDMLPTGVEDTLYDRVYRYSKLWI